MLSDAVVGHIRNDGYAKYFVCHLVRSSFSHDLDASQLPLRWISFASDKSTKTETPLYDWPRATLRLHLEGAPGGRGSASRSFSQGWYFCRAAYDNSGCSEPPMVVRAVPPRCSICGQGRHSWAWLSPLPGRRGSSRAGLPGTGICRVRCAAPSARVRLPGYG